MRGNEILNAYFLQMKQICSKSQAKDAAAINYAINCMRDPVMVKYILYCGRQGPGAGAQRRVFPGPGAQSRVFPGPGALNFSMLQGSFCFLMFF